MIVGNGMLAKRFEEYANNSRYLIFASGVSDSSANSAEAFLRERNLLHAHIQPAKDKTLIYFSTCSIYDSSLANTPYVLHKLEMEKIIQGSFPSYLIFRVSNPIGFTHNRHTVFNFLISHILEGRIFDIWKNARRNILDIDDLFLACKYYLDLQNRCNEIITIANPNNYAVIEMVEAIEKHFSKKGVYHFTERGGGPDIDKLAMEELFRNLNISFGADYLEKILKKYFSNDLPESFTQKKD